MVIEKKNIHIDHSIFYITTYFELTPNAHIWVPGLVLIMCLGKNHAQSGIILEIVISKTALLQVLQFPKIRNKAQKIREIIFHKKKCAKKCNYLSRQCTVYLKR